MLGTYVGKYCQLGTIFLFLFGLGVGVVSFFWRMNLGRTCSSTDLEDLAV